MDFGTNEEDFDGEIIEAAELQPSNTSRKYRNYSDETLQLAIDVVQNGLSVGKAAQKHEIPERTLRLKVKIGTELKRRGQSAFICLEAEKIIVRWCIESAELGDSVTKEELLDAAKEMANAQGNNKFNDGIPCGNWIIKFLERHPEIVKRTPQAVTRASANVSKKNVIDYINGLLKWFD